MVHEPCSTDEDPIESEHHMMRMRMGMYPLSTAKGSFTCTSCLPDAPDLLFYMRMMPAGDPDVVLHVHHAHRCSRFKALSEKARHPIYYSQDEGKVIFFAR